MTREELVEKVESRFRHWFDSQDNYEYQAEEVIDIVLEEAAKVAEGYWWDLEAHPLSFSAEQAKNTAAAIRALKGE